MISMTEQIKDIIKKEVKERLEKKSDLRRAIDKYDDLKRRGMIKDDIYKIRNIDIGKNDENKDSIFKKNIQRIFFI